MRGFTLKSSLNYLTMFPCPEPGALLNFGRYQRNPQLAGFVLFFTANRTDDEITTQTFPDGSRFCISGKAIAARI